MIINNENKSKYNNRQRNCVRNFLKRLKVLFHLNEQNDVGFTL